MKTRIIHTKFYQDSYILSLEPLERWFFLYLLTNERVEKTGAYELPLQIARVETGLEVEEMNKYLSKFQTSGKIFYIEGYVVIKNILKYQDYSKGSEKQVQSYNKELNSLPKRVLDIVLNNDLTSSELVSNQLETGSKLVINNKEEIINNKKEIIKEENLKKFKKPTIEEIETYCLERQNSVNAEKFYNYYESNGWRVGKNPMKDWKAAIRTWENNGYSQKGKMSIDII